VTISNLFLGVTICLSGLLATGFATDFWKAVLKSESGELS